MENTSTTARLEGAEVQLQRETSTDREKGRAGCTEGPPRFGDDGGLALDGPSAVGYDRARELKLFDDTKGGVKGLVDTGVATIPRFFHHHPSSTLSLPRATTISPSLTIPNVDLSLPRPRAVELASAAAREWGFFRVTNHGIPLPAISAALAAVQAFNELPAEAKAAYYGRDGDGGVFFNSNFDLYSSPAASWLDTLRVLMGPTPPDAEKIPEVCRRELFAWEGHARGLAGRVMGLLSEGLGVEAGRLEGIKGMEGCLMLCHYYPYCPQPELTLGLVGHTDPTVLTVLVQNELSGLLVKKESAVEDGDAGGDWVEVEPVPGSVIINVGDALQMISNDEYKSVEHKVLANPHKEPRVSIAVFYNPNEKDSITNYGPLKELVCQQKRARYHEFTMSEFNRVFFTEERRPRSLQDHFKA